MRIYAPHLRLIVLRRSTHYSEPFHQGHLRVMIFFPKFFEPFSADDMYTISSTPKIAKCERDVKIGFESLVLLI